MTAPDRTVVSAIAFMFIAIPLYGTFQIFDPLRVPMPLLVGFGGAATIAAAMLIAAGICAWGAFRRPVPRRIVIGQLSAGTAILIAALAGFDIGTGIALGVIVVAMGLVGVATYGYAAVPGALRIIVGSTLASALLAALLAITMLVTRRPAALYAYDSARAVGIFLNPNELAAYLLVIVGLAAAVACFGRERRLRVLAGVTLAVGLVALALTFSRWGYLSAAAGATFFALAIGGRRTWIAVGACVLAAVLLIAGPGQAHHNPRDDTSRFVAWTTGVRTWLAFPLTGVGPLAYRRTYEIMRPPEAPGGDAPVAFDPHSLPLAFLDESGLLGFVTLLFSWAIYMREIPRALRTATPRQRTLVYAFAAGLVALNVHVLINTISIYFVLATQGAALALALAQWDLDEPAV